MHKIIAIFIVHIFSVMLLQAQNVPVQKSKGNPVIEGWYADPEAAIFNNMYWIFPTYSAPYEQQVFLDAYSSSDLQTWKKHSRIIDTSAVKWARRPCGHRQ